MTEILSGFRLTRLELYNWGTLDQRVWSLTQPLIVFTASSGWARKSISWNDPP